MQRKVTETLKMCSDLMFTDISMEVEKNFMRNYYKKKILLELLKISIVERKRGKKAPISCFTPEMPLTNGAGTGKSQKAGNSIQASLVHTGTQPQEPITAAPQFYTNRMLESGAREGIKP